MVIILIIMVILMAIMVIIMVILVIITVIKVIMVIITVIIVIINCKVNKNCRFFRSNFQLQSLRNCLSKSLEICCASCPTMDPCRLKFQLIRTNGSRVIAVIAVRSSDENISIFFYSLGDFVRYLSYPESFGWVKRVCGGAGKVDKGTPD